MSRPRRSDALWLEECFWPKVTKTDTCWVWSGAVTNGGYGVYQRDGQVLRSHRLSYELANGPIPAGHEVMHACDNPPCVNPVHLSVGTSAENMADKMTKGRARLDERRIATPGAKLNRDLVDWIRSARPAGAQVAIVAADLGVSDVTIYNVLAGRTWRNPRVPDTLPKAE